MAIPQRRPEGAPEPVVAHVEAPAAKPALSDGPVFGLLMGLAVLFRAAIFPFTQNVYGDAVVRTEFAERWLASPHLITSFKDGVYQFGPLHTYVMALALWLWHDRAAAGRIASFIFGVLVLWPTWRVGLRLFGRQGAIWACLALGLWGMHVQMSTTAGSEALALCLFAFAIDGLLQGLDEARFAPLARAALFLNLGCAVRYDLWMYVPLFGLAIALHGKDRVAWVTRAVMFTGLAVVFPLLWMEGNEKAMGDPLYPVHYIDEFHRRWTQDGVAWLGATRFRLWGLVFWPGTLLLTASPLFGLFSLAGVVASAVRKHHRMLLLFVAVPTAYFTARTLMLTFSPLARFTVTQLWLCLFFAYPGIKLVTDRVPRWAGRALIGLVVAVMVLTPAAIAKASYEVDDGWGNSLKPVSPVTTMPRDQMEVAHWLRDNVPAADGLLLDYDDAYTDVGVAFFSNLPEERMVRLRWETEGDDVQARVDKLAPAAVILWKGGKLLQHAGVSRKGDLLDAFGRHYRRARGFADDKFEVFRAE
ncbi:MAG: glycosyltransferase family 39 protein [Deltaproteobacteria bacterium]|nr:glycosyltransferase family 39 protein [Deltaproteobacteria bacterium]